jgi:hypothetical protein
MFAKPVVISRVLLQVRLGVWGCLGSVHLVVLVPLG